MKNIMKNIRNDSLNHKRFCFPPFQSNQFFNSINVGGNNPVKKGSKLNVQTTFRKCPGLLLNVLYTFNLRPVSTGIAPIHSILTLNAPSMRLFEGNFFNWNI